VDLRYGSRLLVLLLMVGAMAAVLFARSTMGQPTTPTSDAVPAQLHRDNPALAEGSRVRVVRSYAWAQGTTGVVTRPPERVRTLAGNWHGVKRMVQGAKAPVHFYWVQFDTPQRDRDDDQLYFAAEIPGGFLELIGDSRVPPPALPEGTVEATWYENKRLGLRVEFKAFIK
jgi:hypothetical protein